MDNSSKLNNIIDRDKTYFYGEEVYSNLLEEELSLDEYDEIKAQLWNETISSEFEQIFREINPAYYDQIQTEENSAKKVKEWFEFDEKYRASAFREWKKQYYTFRFIDGYFYSFHFGLGLNLYDSFDFKRWLPKQFAPQVQRWIEGDLEIAEDLEKKLKQTQVICSLLGVSLISAAIALIISL